ncbi:hypothetical protein NEILACOT_04188 [Neisseria lactamica ATCC 23970]|uniref:Uncharacterized protein n=1 Tax=Neisseria lactamica ATCC 23970 TaxID=546265 RepID=D0W9H6_NEILA|nr:hypothetical protein NEILACOT_04188 [Neisseria lactamica ATCC 23970]
MIESIGKPQESIGKNRNPHRPSFPQKRESSNTTQQESNPEKTETPTASFPQKRESSNTTQQEFIGKTPTRTD